MPFDASNDHPPAVRMFDELIAFFGPSGERWCPLGWTMDDRERRCILSAARMMVTKRRVAAGTGYAAYLDQAILEVVGEEMSISAFNDSRLSLVGRTEKVKQTLGRAWKIFVIHAYEFQEEEITTAYLRSVLPVLLRARALADDRLLLAA